MGHCDECGNNKVIHVGSEEVVQVLVKAIEHKVHATKGHGKRVSQMSRWLSNYLGIDEASTQSIGVAGYLHDCGMLSVPLEIITKKGRLTEKERLSIKRHPLNAALYFQESTGLDEVLQIIREHHEWFDGSGYPVGLEGNKIHLGARIIALCEMIDTMLHKQIYQPANTFEAVSQEVVRMSGKQLDPWLVMHIKELLIVWQEKYGDQTV